MASNANVEHGKKGRPKAAVKFPCGTCSKSTSGCAALLCNICEMWHHKDCITGMTDAMYSNLLAMNDSLGYSFYLCAKCDKVHKKTWQAVNQMSKRMEKIEDRLTKIENSLKENEESHKQIATKVKIVEESAPGSPDSPAS